MPSITFGLGGESHDESIGEATLNYNRTTVRYVERIPFSEVEHPVESEHVIIGSLAVKGQDGAELGTLRFTNEGMRYEYTSKADGQKHTLPMRRLIPESELLFTADDSTFQQHFVPMLAFAIAQHHDRPEELEQHISATCQSAPKYGQAISLRLPPREDRGEGHGVG